MNQNTASDDESATPKPRYWFRVHHDTFYDDKLRPLPVAQRWVWLAILAAASKSPVRGFLLRVHGDPMTDVDLADLANVSVREVKRTIPVFAKLQMVEWHAEFDCWAVTNWDRRQYEADKSVDRTRRWREKKRAEMNAEAAETSQVTGKVTPILRHRDGTKAFRVSHVA